MTEHTPGPWTQRGHTIMANGEVIAYATNDRGSYAVTQGNAKLMADALRLRETNAELLFHLKDITRLLANSTDPKEDVAIADNLEECIRGRLPSIRATIARAEEADNG